MTVVKAMKAAWSINLKELNSWPDIDLLRTAANCIKHGEGGSCENLRTKRPTWFDSSYPFTLPLGDFGLNIPDEYLSQAIDAVKNFLAELQIKLLALKG